MTKRSGKKTAAKGKASTELPGVSLERFEAGTGAVAAMRDRGKMLVFLGYRRSVHLIGDKIDFIEEFNQQLDKPVELTPDEADEVLGEIRQFLAGRITTGDSETVVKHLLRAYYDDEVKKLDSDAKKQFEQLLEKKAELVEEHLLTASLQTRNERLKQSAASLLEDIEFELVQERTTSASDKPFEEPFLRLCLRYSDGTDPSLAIGFPWFFANTFSFGKEHCFELECDETDIDLLMLRLTTAKARLLEAREMKSDVNNE